MAQTVTFTGTFGSSHDSSTTYSVTGSAGTASPNSGITKAQLESGINITFSDDSIESATCVAENGTCVGEDAYVSWGVTPTPDVVPTPTPDVVPTPTPDVVPTPTPDVPTPTAINWQFLGTGTVVLETDSNACSATQNIDYYTIEAAGAGSQLYTAQDTGTAVTDNGRMVINTTLWTIVNNGELGEDGSCPTYFDHTIYVSTARTAPSGLCDDNYTITVSKLIKTTANSFDLSNGLNEQVYNTDGTPWSPPGSGTLFYAVDKTNSRTTQDGSEFTWYEINPTGVVGSVGNQTCVTPTPNTPSPPPSDSGAPSVAPVDTPREN